MIFIYDRLILDTPMLLKYSQRSVQDVTVPAVTLTRKVDPGLQDLRTWARRILAEKNAEKAKENTWIGRMIVAECYETSIFISFLDYWQVTLIWSPYGDDSFIRSFTYW